MIVLYFDKNFFYWSRIYILSIINKMENTLIFIYGVNLLNEQISELKSFSDNIKIQNHIVKFDGIQKRINGSGKDAKWKIMMQCQISYVILEAIDFAKKK